MRKFTNHRIGVSQGERVLFSDFVDDGPMWVGTGPREQRHAVKFEARYSDPPVVHVALSMWDLDHKQNQRMDISAENITEVSFDLVFKTWGDSRVARVRASWMVIGALPHDDDWELY